MPQTFGEAVELWNRLDQDVRRLEKESPDFASLRYARYLEARRDEIAQFIGTHIVIHHNVKNIDLRDIHIL